MTGVEFPARIAQWVVTLCHAAEDAASTQPRIQASLGSFFVSIGLALVLGGVILARKIKPIEDDEDPLFFSMGGRKPTGKLMFAVIISVLGGLLAVVGMLNM